MHRHTDVQDCEQEWVLHPTLPGDHVLNSGAVLFPGAFDQHGCPLIVFPLDGQTTLSSELGKAEVVDFINYFLRLHNKMQEKQTLVSVVADLRQASLPTVRFIAETLLLLQLHKATLHAVYIIQPQKKDAVKLLLKLLASSKSPTPPLKKVFLKEISELSNYVDRSQLMTQLGGYFIYCHQSWVAFIKEIDAFVKEFLSVVRRLPSCISTLRALSRLPPPSTFSQLQLFCSTNEAKFQQLRGELGLDQLLRHCEIVLEKLRYPEMEPCYQAMAGTALFTHTTFDMLQNHSRIMAAVEKVELLWQQAFSEARLQLQVFQLREDAQQIKEQIATLNQEKLQPYKVEIAEDAAEALMLLSEFEASIHTPALALVRCADDVIHTLAETPPCDAHTGARWVLDLERLKEKLHSAVNFIHQTLRAVSKYHRYHNKASGWYALVLCESFLQDLLSGLGGERGSRQRRDWASTPAWRHKISTFLKRNPPPDPEELLHLAHLSSVIPDGEVQQEGKQMSQRCLTLRKLLVSSGPVAVAPLQLALQWQYQWLRGRTRSGATVGTTEVVTQREPGLLRTSPSAAVSAMVSAEGKAASLSSFDSGFDGAGSSQLEAGGGRAGPEGLSGSTGAADFASAAVSPSRMHRGSHVCSGSGPEDHRQELDSGSVGNSSGASIQIIPKVTQEALNLEITVRRSAALPTNPWLSLPVDDLENSYTVTITQTATPQRRSHRPPDTCAPAGRANRSRDQPTQTGEVSGAWPSGPRSQNWMVGSESSLEDLDLSPVCNILSSTITEERDKSLCSTEEVPTLLWDSYDLHGQEQDSVDSLMDVSLEDWDLKEQEGLREVEEILGRADEILEKEEKVLAQEVELEALLRSEVQNNPWMWDREDQHGSVSSAEIAGGFGLEDYLDPVESDLLSEPSSTASKTSDDDGRRTRASPEPKTTAVHGRMDLLTELKKVHLLDEMIMEENLKIHMLRHGKEGPGERLHETQPSNANGPTNMSKEREAFRVQLEKEKREVDQLEKSLGEEGRVMKDANVTRKVVICSIQEKALEENMVCDELSSARCDEAPASSLTAGPQPQDRPERTVEVLGSDVAQLTIPQDLVQDSHLQHDCSEAEPVGSFILKGPPEEERRHPRTVEELDRSTEEVSSGKPEASMRPDDGAFDPGGKHPSPPVPLPRRASLPVSVSLLEQGTLRSTERQIPDLPLEIPDLPTLDLPVVALDLPVVALDLPVVALDLPVVALDLPVVALDLPVVALDPDLLPLDRLNDETDALVVDVTSETRQNPVLKASATEHNNNPPADPHMSDMTEDEDEGSDVPPCLPWTHLGPEEETQTAAPVEECPPPVSPPPLPPERSLEADPSVGEEPYEDIPDPSSEVMRASGSGSHEIEAQIDSTAMKITDFKTPIVLDTGSGLMKAGFADQDLPNLIFPTIIGRPKYEEIMNGDTDRDAYIGHEAQHMRGVLTLRHPIKNGIIRNWDEMEKIWHHTFQQLCVDPADHPVLLTEAAMTPRENRQRMVEIMFEGFGVPFTCVALQAVLALYGSGRTTGVVFDSGDGVSHSVPVFEGYALPHSVQRFPLAGADVTMHLKKLLQEQGVCMRTTAEVEIVREMKEKCCCVALGYEDEMSRGGASLGEVHYSLPDGQIVTLDTERFRAPEILFKPEMIGRDHYGMHESVFKSILSSDIDLRRCFLGNIVLSGGNTLLVGLPERLQAEITGLVAANMADAVRVTSPEDRHFTVWRGGAVLANLTASSAGWISCEEYEEYGPQIVFRKCF